MAIPNISFIATFLTVLSASPDSISAPSRLSLAGLNDRQVREIKVAAWIPNEIPSVQGAAKVSEDKSRVLCSAAQAPWRDVSPLPWLCHAGSTADGPTDLFVPQCAFCGLCSVSGQPGRSLPASLVLGACLRTTQLTSSRELNVSGKSLWTHGVRSSGEFPCRMKYKPEVQVETGPPGSMVSQTSFFRKVE